MYINSLPQAFADLNLAKHFENPVIPYSEIRLKMIDETSNINIEEMRKLTSRWTKACYHDNRTMGTMLQGKMPPELVAKFKTIFSSFEWKNLGFN